jgi:hypothetical protein
MNARALLFGSLSLCTGLAACSGKEEAAEAAPPPPAEAPAERETSVAAPSTEVPGTAVERAPGAPLVFEPPSTWLVETPSSTQRKAQYKLPRVEGDAKDAECVVFFFGEMGGGGVEANLDRWCSQFEQPDGRDSKEVLVRSERKVAGMTVHEAELSGTYVAETSPGSGVRVNEPGWKMLAAIVESDHGAYYVKLTGPAATVDAHASEFRDFIGRVK